ncbi:MAG: hypothetical protein FJZ00_09935, partial [Candidatus Sericytochromatia bacterium]|nr:hypothetical protein [Candidatus Tanganyikabacteria bacterium]
MDVGRVTSSSGLPQGGEEAGARPLQDGDVLVGKVLSTTGRMARVNVDGRTIDVQTAVPLSPGDELQMKVKNAGGQIRLQVIALQGKGSLMDDPHVAELLEKMGLPTDKASLAAAKALLAESGSVEPQQVRDMARLAAQLKTPEEKAAAAFLIARGLPATPEAVQLAIGRHNEAGTAGKKLADKLDALKKAAGQGSSDLLSALAGLELADPQGAGDLAEELARFVKQFNPPEAEILAFLKDRQGDLAERLAQNLSAILEGKAQETPEGAVKNALKELSGEVRFQQLSDSATASRPAPAEVRVPLMFPGATGELVVEKWQGNAKDTAGHSRVVLNLSMDSLGPITVDLMYSKGHVGGRLTVPDGDTREFLADRL